MGSFSWIPVISRAGPLSGHGLGFDHRESPAADGFLLPCLRLENAEEAPRSEEPRGPAPRREKSAIEKVILGDGRRQGLAEAMAKSVARQVGSSLGRQIIRGVLGSILKR